MLCSGGMMASRCRHGASARGKRAVDGNARRQSGRTGRCHTLGACLLTTAAQARNALLRCHATDSGGALVLYSLPRHQRAHFSSIGSETKRLACAA
jgi:hypothetical protein